MHQQFRGRIKWKYTKLHRFRQFRRTLEIREVVKAEEIFNGVVFSHEKLPSI
jgi:hypothetical protein